LTSFSARIVSASGTSGLGQCSSSKFTCSVRSWRPQVRHLES
jgi:hypothetical protein